MFSSAGIAEIYYHNKDIEVLVANELIEKRARFYSAMYPNTKMITGDITKSKIKQKFISELNDDVKLLIATPPCQGVSTLGVNKSSSQMEEDIRNYLIYDVIDVIDSHDFDYILIENVPRYLQMFFPYKGDYLHLEQILNDKYKGDYIIDIRVLNAKDYGIPQSRPRAIIKIFKKHLSWDWPEEENEITLHKAIGHLPTLESGQKSKLKYHYAKEHNEREILCMRHTATGSSAITNLYHYPKKNDGSRIKGFHNTYKRMKWDSPCPARTMNSGNIGSHNNVHPGRLLPDGTYSDARVLSLRELFIVSSLPEEWNYPEGYSDNFIRQIIGEAIPPLLSYKILKGIKL